MRPTLRIHFTNLWFLSPWLAGFIGALAAFCLGAFDIYNFSMEDLGILELIGFVGLGFGTTFVIALIQRIWLNAHRESFNKKIAIAWLRAAKTTQVPPRLRTIKIDRYLVRVQFPWLTFVQDGLNLWVFHNDKPWKTYEEAIDNLYVVTGSNHNHNSVSQVCLGTGATQIKKLGGPTVYWQTEFGGEPMFTKQYSMKPYWKSIAFGGFYDTP